MINNDEHVSLAISDIHQRRVQWHDDVGILLNRITDLDDIKASAERLVACISDQRVDSEGKEHIYIRIGDTEYGYREGDSNEFLAALYDLKVRLEELKGEAS